MLFSEGIKNKPRINEKSIKRIEIEKEQKRKNEDSTLQANKEY